LIHDLHTLSLDLLTIDTTVLPFWKKIIFTYLCNMYLFMYTRVQHDFHFRWCSCHLTGTRRVTLVEQESPILPEFIPAIYLSGIHVVQYVVFCVLLVFLSLSLGHCIAFPSICVFNYPSGIFKLFFWWLYTYITGLSFPGLMLFLFSHLQTFKYDLINLVLLCKFYNTMCCVNYKKHRQDLIEIQLILAVIWLKNCSFGVKKQTPNQNAGLECTV